MNGIGAVSGCENNWLEWELEVAERGTGVTEIGLSGDWRVASVCATAVEYSQ